MTFLSKIVSFLDNVEKYCTAGQVTGDSISRCMSIACWIPKATNTHSEYAILLVFTLKNGYKNAHQLYIHFLSCYTQNINVFSSV